LQPTKLNQALVGKATDSLFAVDNHLCIDDVCKQFDFYVCLKYEPPTERTAQTVFETMILIRGRLTDRTDCQHGLNLLEPKRTSFSMTSSPSSMKKKRVWLDGADH